MHPQGEYIYGIVEEPRPRRFSFPGIGSADVYNINHEQIAAVVSDAGFSEIDPTRKNVQAHTVVQEELLKEYNLLPMGFGMVASGKGEVCRLLEDNYDGLLGELHRLNGKIEVELKVFWDQETIIKAGKLVESIVQDWKTRYAELVYAILQELSFEAKVNSPVGIKNLLNASFLIEKSHESEFKERVYKLDAKFQGKMNFKYVGPLPPYNFVNLKLEPVKC